ncbi:DgyrCDS13640 [Dimorphilus gyrociliatus]|uniref:DgyrCDS13640 n=1 Tax=Dimorphilus gyrociliatus TaxID=2664684 RepID=A0A7I8WB98_9ANNE|nr:DgyrCDS13640 [Dimorphilus gyrociliatus]
MLYSICESENACEQSSDTSFFDVKSQVCIYLIFKNLTWFESVIYCKHKTWRLFQPSESKLTSLQLRVPLVTLNKFWIDMKNFALEWISDGNSVTFTNWKTNYPDVENDCVAVSGQEWITQDCSLKNYVVCSKLAKEVTKSRTHIQYLLLVRLNEHVITGSLDYITQETSTYINDKKDKLTTSDLIGLCGALFIVIFTISLVIFFFMKLSYLKKNIEKKPQKNYSNNETQTSDNLSQGNESGKRSSLGEPDNFVEDPIVLNESYKPSTKHSNVKFRDEMPSNENIYGDVPLENFKMETIVEEEDNLRSLDSDDQLDNIFNGFESVSINGSVTNDY